MSDLARNFKEMTMDKVTFIDITDPLTNITTEYAIIDWGNGNFTSMTKAEYEKEYPSELA